MRHRQNENPLPGSSGEQLVTPMTVSVNAGSKNGPSIFYLETPLSHAGSYDRSIFRKASSRNGFEMAHVEVWELAE